jgi:SWI/SNF-related matrix-associated actin-dependent regulator of chromatin subfamily A-like protein 1
MRTRAPAVIRGEPSVKIAAAYGRLYVSGSHANLLRRLPGATEHEQTRSYMLSLTLESLRAIRETLQITREQMVRLCTPAVLAWAKAAGAQERQILQLHQKLETGWRADLPWTDTRAGTPAPESAPDEHVEWLDFGGLTPQRVWKYRAPFEHQKVMATCGLELNGCAFICEQGTAKTRPAVEAARQKFRNGEIEYVFVACPKGVMNTWAREIGWWAPDLQVVQLRGPVRDRRTIVNAHTNGGITTRGVVFVLNYDALADMKDDILALLSARKALFICDEMHTLANPQAQVTQAAMEIARVATSRLGLTGTPIRNGAEDIWSQWYVIDMGVTFGANFVQFRREFFNENPYTWSIDPVSGQTLGEIGQRLRLRGLRYRKEDCFDLPPKVYEVIEVEMTREQSAAYREMQDYLVAWLRGEEAAEPLSEDQVAVAAMLGPGDSDEDSGPVRVRATGDRRQPTRSDGRVATAANQLVAILRLTQITSGFLPTEDGSVHFFSSNPKLVACNELVRDHVRNGRSVIVWATYRNDIEGLMAQFRDLRPVRIDGTQQGTRGERERLEAERKFQERETQLLIANPAAGGVGLNLQAASVAIYFSQSYSLIDRMQSEDRCHRSGSEIHNRVTYIDLVCSGTVDETVRAALAAKKSVADAVVDLREAIGA